jgi:hypothetical protein
MLSCLLEACGVAHWGERKKMKVKNLNGASLPETGYGNRLSLWEEVSGQSAYLCAVKGCIGQPSTGGLVQRDGLMDGNWYVVPLCADCSTHTRQDLDIWDLAKLVSVLEIKSTCATSHRRQAPLRRVSKSPDWRGVCSSTQGS